MTHAEREKLKENLRTMAVRRGDGIDLDTPFRWVVEGILQPEPFFRSLPTLLPSDAILYFEGASIARDVSEFYELHRASNAVAVARDSIHPVPEIYHAAMSQEVLAGLCDYAASKPKEQLFDHIKAYRGESLLFTFHDAFENYLLISEHVTEPAVKEFCNTLGGTFRREQNINRRDPEVLRKFLEALENPYKIRIAGEPWWRRLWRRWTW